MEQKDNGDWLSAQQAVRPDGTELTNLPLINKKLPPLSGSVVSAAGIATMGEVVEAAKESDMDAAQKR